MIRAAFIAAMLAAPAAAATCGPKKALTTTLADKYHEAPVGGGITVAGQGVLTIYTSPDGSTWTAVMTTGAGLSCIMAAGTVWMVLTVKVGEPM